MNSCVRCRSEVYSGLYSTRSAENLMNRKPTFSVSTISTLALIFMVSAVARSDAQSLSNPTKLYTGSVYTQGTEQVVEEAMLYVYEDPYTTPVTSSHITTTTGEYRVLLDPAKLYWFRVEALGHFTDDFMVATPSGTTYEERKENLPIRPIPLDSVLYSGRPFAGETADWSEEEAIRNVLAFLDENPTVKVEIGVGLEVDEVDPLTQSRVNAIKQIFRDMNISTTRIKWERKLDNPFGMITMTIDGFEMP